MESFENTLTIQKPAAEVFAFLANFENVPRWNYAIAETHKTSPGAVGVGTTYSQTRSIPAESEEGFEVTVFEPVKRLAIQGQLGPFQAVMRYQLEAAGSATRLTNAVELEPTSALMRVVVPFATNRVRKAIADNLSQLKAILEDDGPTGHTD